MRLIMITILIMTRLEGGAPGARGPAAALLKSPESLQDEIMGNGAHAPSRAASLHSTEYR